MFFCLFVCFTFSRCSIVTCTVIRKNVTQSVILENPFHCWLVGMHNGAVTVENSMAVDQKIKHRITI